MKYLVHFRPDQELSDLISLEDGVVLPKAGLHVTLCRFYMREAKEATYINELKSVRFAPFNVETVAFSEFDGDTVIRLSKPDALARLHKAVVRSARQYAENSKQFDQISKTYYFDKYQPHLTISSPAGRFKSSTSDAQVLLGHNMPVSEFYLSKQMDAWIDVVSFRAR